MYFIIMSKLKLEYNNEFITIDKNNNFYVIENVKQWIFLTKFEKSYLITSFPKGEIETTVDRKFIYRQDYILINDLNFKYRYILPLGNFTNNNVPFTGTFDGNNHIIKNLNIINSENNGLFGITRLAIIKNLKLMNIYIENGNFCSPLIGRGFNTEISNIQILGSILINGLNCSCFCSNYEGNGNNILICCEGELNGDNTTLFSNNFYGNIENVNIISNIKCNTGFFDTVNGRIKNSNLISFYTINNPFYNTTKYHQITNCYYFQLNNEKLPEMQELYNCYYKNLDEIIYSNGNENEIHIHLKNIINYSDNNLDNDYLFYNYKNNFHNLNDLTFININNKFISQLKIKNFNKNNILSKCSNYKEIYEKEKLINEKIIEININNNKIKINNILSTLYKNENIKLYDNVNSEKLNQELLEIEIDNTENINISTIDNLSDDEFSDNKILIDENIIEIEEMKNATHFPIFHLNETPVE